MRWKDNDHFIQPIEFIPIFENSGLISQLDMYMFESCCQLMQYWRQNTLEIFPISVNFSRSHITNSNFVNELIKITYKYAIKPQMFTIEFTETTTIENIVVIGQIIDELHKAGFSVSMDDFGSGYSSLGFLEQIFVDEIKLDKSLIDNITTNARTLSIVKNVIALSNEIGINIVAEGVETIQQKEILKTLNCQIAQGYYYSQPVDCEIITNYLYENKASLNLNLIQQ